MTPSEALPTVLLDGEATHRLVPSRFPPVNLFERVADARDLDAVFAVEALTNPRLRQEAGDISLVAPEDRLSGPGSSAVMAAFTHLNPAGSRFTDGRCGVYYAAFSLLTAVREVGHHQARFLAATAEPAIDIDLRCYRARLRRPLHDLRGRRETLPAVYDPDRYDAAQALGAALRAAASWGVVYDSVRDPGGHCVGVFRPTALTPAVQGQHVALRWDGKRMASWHVTSEPRLL